MKNLDLSEQKFGRLTVIKPIGKDARNNILWLCKCDCGSECIKATYVLKSGRAKSCGCYKEDCTQKNTINMTGKRVGILTVLESNGHDKEGRMTWKCQCDCGKIVCVSGKQLRKGQPYSCGCVNIEVKHGMSKTRLYKIWQAMKQRCYNPTSFGYSSYGGRGISVCEEWRQSFEEFFAWAQISGYKEHDLNMSIDRIDVNGNYCPENCRWATQKEQCNNRRDNRLITYCGQTKTLSEWVSLLHLSDSTVRTRLCRGWSVENAFERPVQKKKQEECDA